MTSFHEVRFPDNIAYGATGGPEFATTVVATSAGHEKRNVNWAEARSRWDVAGGLKRQAQIDELIAFFRARRGKAYGFRFKDWTDYQTAGEHLGTGDDTQTQFQLVKHYPSGSVIEVHTITKPVAGTFYLNGIRVAQMSDTLPIDLNSAALGIGRHVSGIADPFNGHIDAFRIVLDQRSDGWIATTWNNMSNPGAFAAAGAEEQEGGGPPPLAGAGVVVCLMG